MTAVLVFAAAGLGTYLARESFVLLVGDRELPGWAERIVRNVGPPVLAALTASLLLDPDVRSFVTSPSRVVAVVVAVFFAWKTKGFLWSFFGGMTVFWLLEAVL